MPDYRWRENIIGWALAVIVVIDLIVLVFKMVFL